MENSLKIVKFIKTFLDNNYFKTSLLKKEHIQIYYSNYDSTMSNSQRNNILNKFNESKFGIISNVYCLAEGYNNVIIDGVVFAENMNSNIRIVQSALRASRKNNLQPKKVTKIILPILNDGEWLENNNNSDLKKVKEVIYQMSLEDESICQKIKVYNIDVKKQIHCKNNNDNNNNDANNNDNNSDDNNGNDDNNSNDDNNNNYNAELTKNLRLKIMKRTTIGTTYEKAKKIIASNNIKNKEEYFKLCEKDTRLSDEPEITYKGSFTNWIEYLGIDRIFYDLKTCIEKVNYYLKQFTELNKYNLELSKISSQLCKMDNNFPPDGLWSEYYGVKDLRNIIIISESKKKIGNVL